MAEQTNIANTSSVEKINKHTFSTNHEWFSLVKRLSTMIDMAILPKKFV